MKKPTTQEVLASIKNEYYFTAAQGAAAAKDRAISQVFDLLAYGARSV